MRVSKQGGIMKKRRNFTLSAEALQKLSEMAKKEGRSQSAMIERLIVQGGDNGKMDRIRG